MSPLSTRSPPHTQRNSRVKKGEIEQRLRFQCWPVSGCLYKPVALSHDISHTTCRRCPSLQPQNPQPLSLVTPWKSHRKKNNAKEKRKMDGLYRKKSKVTGREVKNESKRQRKCKASFWRVAVTSYECSCVCPFRHNCVRTLTGVYVSWCFPAVFHHQTISHSKQLQKPSSPSPPIISSALLPPITKISPSPGNVAQSRHMCIQQFPLWISM